MESREGLGIFGLLELLEDFGVFLFTGGLLSGTPGSVLSA